MGECFIDFSRTGIKIAAEIDPMFDPKMMTGINLSILDDLKSCHVYVKLLCSSSGLSTSVSDLSNKSYDSSVSYSYS